MFRPGEKNMSEAKKKRQQWLQQQAISREMRPARFNLYAIGTRMSPALMMSEEISYWSDIDEKMIGVVFRDVTDNDFGWIMMARDRIGRFRCVAVEASLRSPEYAARGLRTRIAVALEDDEIETLGDQGDETNYPTDLLAIAADTKPDDLHPHFRILMDTPGREPARAVFREIGPWLAPSDPHFVNEFQRKQFDQRMWELYLWASFREMGFDVRQPEAPDFLCSKPGLRFTAEATTVASSTSGPLSSHPNPKTSEEMEVFLTNYMPMKFGSSLTSKLNKKNKDGQSYWERAETKQMPFVLAIADFHIPGGNGEVGSMTYTQAALWPYLYGHRLEWEFVDGSLRTTVRKGEDHSYGSKSVPTGFFDLPGAENISGVLFSNAGTLAKFDRMGVAAGFGAEDHKYFRFGLRLDRDPNSINGTPFVDELDVEHREGWADELQFFHNPNAKHPIPRGSLLGCTEHYFRDGDYFSYSYGDPVLGSRTILMRLVGEKEIKETV